MIINEVGHSPPVATQGEAGSPSGKGLHSERTYSKPAEGEIRQGSGEGTERRLTDASIGVWLKALTRLSVTHYACAFNDDLIVGVIQPDQGGKVNFCQVPPQIFRQNLNLRHTV